MFAVFVAPFDMSGFFVDTMFRTRNESTNFFFRCATQECNSCIRERSKTRVAMLAVSHKEIMHYGSEVVWVEGGGVDIGAWAGEICGKGNGKPSPVRLMLYFIFTGPGNIPLAGCWANDCKSKGRISIRQRRIERC